ncbi:MAG: hypothetical protein IJF76_03010 [Clostridia bacterium]|nr:hypothetical protein [Clostridia bacterium]
MKKIAKIILVLAVVAMLASALCVGASASGSVETFSQLYIGEYTQDGSDIFTGMAHVVFGTVSDTTAEYGIILKTEDDRFFKFAGKKVGSNGKFGVAIYEVPEGDYVAYAYTGDDETRVLGEPTYFTAGKATNTVSFDMSAVGGTSTEKVVAQGTATEFTPSTDGLTAPAGGVVGLFNADGSAYDANAVVKSDATVTAKWIADPAVKANSYTLNFGKVAANIGSAIPVDLSDGSTVYMEMDVLESLGWANVNVGFQVHKYLPSGTSNESFGGHHDMWWFGNSAYTSSSDNYKGMWKVEDLSNKTIPTRGDAYVPATIFSAGNTVKFAYTAPTSTTAGSMYIYTKATGADDSAYTVAAFAEDIALDMALDTSNVYIMLYVYAGQAVTDITVTNYHIYTEKDGDIPAMFTYNYIEVTRVLPKYTVDYVFNGSALSSEEVEEGSLATAPTVDGAPINGVAGWYDEDGNKFDFEEGITEDVTVYGRWDGVDISAKKYSVDATTGNVGFGTSYGQDLSDGSTLNFEFDFVSGSISRWQNFNSYIMLGTDNRHATTTARFYTYQYGNYAYYEPWVGHYGTQNNLTNAGVNNGEGWGQNLWYIAGQTLKFSYTAPTENTTGSINVYTKTTGADDSTYVLTSWTTNLTLANVQDTSNVFMGFKIDSGSGRSFIMKGWRAWVDRVGGGVESVPGFNVDTNFAGTVTELKPGVTFDMSGIGGATTSVEVNPGEKVAKPDATNSDTAYGGGGIAYVTEDGYVWDFENDIVEADMTLYAYPAADPAVKAKTWLIQNDASVGSAQLMTGAPVDLSAGKTLNIEMDVLSGVGGGNFNLGFMLWQYLPTYGGENAWFSGFHDCSWYGNPAYLPSDGDPYTGIWSRGQDFTDIGGDVVKGAKFMPNEIFATGNSVKFSYTAPTSTTAGSMIIYVKAIGAADSEYTEVASIRGLTTANVVSTSSTYAGLWFAGAAKSMTVTNYHVYMTGSYDIPAMFDFNAMVVTEVTE